MTLDGALPFGALTPAVFVRRDNRFRAQICVDGIERACHVPNSGRLAELLLPGAPIYVRPARRPGRVTAFDLILVQSGAELVCIDARWPPALVAAAWHAGRLPEFAGYEGLRREVSVGESRLDLLFTTAAEAACWVETKCVTLVQAGVALFPDAPTERGRRHLETLATLAAGGACACVLFIIQRADACAFAPHDAMDAAFGEALRAAISAGVRVVAYTCHITPAEIALAQSIPLAF